MQTGLHHLHTSFAHLLVLVTLVNMFLAVLGAGKKPGLAKVMKWTHRVGVLALGRVIYVAGLGLAMVGGYDFTSPWILAGLLLSIGAISSFDGNAIGGFTTLSPSSSK